MKKFLSSEIWQNLKAKFHNYGFWVSLVGAIIMFLQSIGINIAGDVNEIVSAICSILVVLGIASNPNSGKGFIDKVKSNKKDGNTEINITCEKDSTCKVNTNFTNDGKNIENIVENAKDSTGKAVIEESTKKNTDKTAMEDSINENIDKTILEDIVGVENDNNIK